MGKGKGVDASAPGWLVTYGDLMSLIMCFFILLFALSEVSKGKMADTAQAVRESLHDENVMQTRHPVARRQTFNDIVEDFAKTKFSKYKEKGGSFFEGPEGDTFQVNVQDEGLRVNLPATALFAPGEATLTAGVRRALDQLADDVRGVRNRIDVRGFDDVVPLDEGTRWLDKTDKWDIGYARARAVADYLINVKKIEPYRVRITSGGRFDPAAPDIFAQEAEQRNRRVEIFITEEQVRTPSDVSESP